MHTARTVLPTAALILATVGLATAAGCGSAGPTGDSTPTKAAVNPMMGTCEAGASTLKPVAGPGQSATIALASFSEGPHAGKTLALVADEDAKSLSIIDVDSKKEIGTQKLDGTPGQVMVLEDGRVLVTLRENNKLAVFHADSDGKMTPGCAIDTAAEPVAMATTPDGKTLLLTAGWGQSLEAFDTAALSRKAKVALPREPRQIVVDDEGKHAYVTHAVGARISIIELSTMKPQRKLDVLVNPNQMHEDMLDKPFSLASAVSGAVGDANGEKPIAGRFGTRMGCQAFPMVKSTAPKGRILAPQILVDPGDPENRAQGYGEGGVPTEVPAVAVIDAGTRKFVSASFAMTQDRFFNHRGGEMGEAAAVEGECILPRGAAVDNDTSTLFVTCLGIDAVVAYDAASANPSSVEKARWDVGSGPTGIAVESSKKRAIVWSQFERSLEIVDLASMGAASEKKPERIALAPMADPLPLSYQLGRQIFHATSDARISADGRACASCHPDGRDDAITWSTPEGPRRTIMLAGRLQGTAPFSWNGVNKDVREHLTHTFERLNGQGLRNVELEALVTFIESMPAPPKANDVDVKLVKQGESLFHSSEAKCASCHADGGQDAKNHDLGLKARADRKAQFNTPSLSYLSGRGPYFHDGRFESLRDLLVQSDGQMGHTKHLKQEDLNALEAYLNTL